MEPNRSVTEEAHELVHGDRGKDYGHPYTDYECTTDIWRAMIKRRYGIDVPLTPDFGCLMMAVVKVSRECGKSKRDNRVDMCGYIECEQLCLDFEKPLP